LYNPNNTSTKRKLGFSTVIGKSDKGDNGRSAFVTVICERGGSYTEHKKLTRRKISSLVKSDCSWRFSKIMYGGSVKLWSYDLFSITMSLK
jgi:hypothetical protein